MKTKKRTKIIIIAIIVLVIALVAGGIVYYEYHVHSGYRKFNRNRQMNFQLNSSQINDIKNFFANNTDLTTIKDYCSTNRLGCFYYCRNINQTADICKEIMNYTRISGGRQR